MSRRLIFALLSAVLMGWPCGALAQAMGADEGTFRVMVNGRAVGTEEFSIRQSGSGVNAEVVATGQIQLRLPEGTLELSPRLRGTGLQHTPTAYQVDVGGDTPRRIVGTVGGGRFSARITSPGGEQLREFVASRGAIILDEGVAHHYYFLAQRTREGQVPILIPRENRQVMATVRSLGEERMEVDGTMLNVYHLSVVPEGGEERRVWVDALGRVMRVEIPSRNYVAIRTTAPQ